MDNFTMAKINLNAILRNLKDLCEMDTKASEIIKSKKVTIQFVVKGGINGTLFIDDGKAFYEEGKHPSDITLYFFSPQHLNEMFNGTKLPFPLKGITKLGFLQNEFIKLTDRLVYFLRPTDELLEDADYLRINTYLTAYTAFFALSEIANNDELGKINAHRIPEGDINISVIDGPAVHLTSKNGQLKTNKGLSDKPRAIMEFNDIESTNKILNGKLDVYTAIGEGRFSLKGFIPMLDNMNKILDQVQEYVQ